jgi:protein TonB
VNEAAVVLRVLVQADGSVQAVNVLADPGSGFGDAARTCAMRTPFRPALDDDGGPVAAWSPPIRVRFLR